MKILIASDIYHPHPGGVSEHIHHTYVEFKKLGHEVKILTPSFGKRPGNPDVVRAGRAIQFPIEKSFGIIIAGLGVSKKVSELLKRETFDVIHLHGPYACLPTIVLKHSKSTNIATFHASSPYRKRYAILARTLRRFLERIDGYIAVSPVAAETMKEYLDVEFRIIPNGVDTERFSPEVERLPKFADHRPTILFIGRLEPRKGLKYLLPAFELVAEKLPDARLLIVGTGVMGGYYRSLVQSRIKKNTYFEGFVRTEDVPRYYASCDVFCSPAVGGESFGIVLLEAMASGKAIVASSIDGYKKVIQNREDGLLVEPENPRALAEALLEVLTNRELRHKLSTQGREKVMAYSWERITKQLEAFYYETMEKKGSHRK
jgi:phosphatidylinositol alpha-mannosyltransferase